MTLKHDFKTRFKKNDFKNMILKNMILKHDFKNIYFTSYLPFELPIEFYFDISPRSELGRVQDLRD